MTTATAPSPGLIDLPPDLPGEHGLRFPVALTPDAFARAVRQWDGRVPAGTTAARRLDDVLVGLAYAIRQRGRGRDRVTFPAILWEGRGRTTLGQLVARAGRGEDGTARVVVDVG